MPHMPKREDELARPRHRKGGNTVSVTKGIARPTSIPRADRSWHPIAKRLYNSLKTSGQADFYQNSDWALAYSLCDDLSRYKRAEDRAEQMNERRDLWYSLTPEARVELGMDPKYAPPHGGKGGSAMKLTATLSALAGLMVTEGDRRKIRVELEAPEEDGPSAEVTAIADYRSRLAAS